MIWLICYSTITMTYTDYPHTFYYCDDLCQGTFFYMVQADGIGEAHKCIVLSSEELSSGLLKLADDICPINESIQTPIPPQTAYPAATPLEPEPPQTLPPMPTPVPPQTAWPPQTPDPPATPLPPQTAWAAQTPWPAPTAVPGATAYPAITPFPPGTVIPPQSPWPAQTLPPMPTGIVIILETPKEYKIYWVIGSLGLIVIIEGILIGYAIYLHKRKPRIEPEPPQEIPEEDVINLPRSLSTAFTITVDEVFTNTYDPFEHDFDSTGSLSVSDDYFLGLEEH